jgi:thioredoxin 1
VIVGRRAAILAAVAVGLAGAVLARGLRPEPAPTASARAGAPRVVELGSTRCVSCRAMREELARVRAACGEALAVEEIDALRDRAAAAPYAITVIPTQVLLDAEGRELERHEGFLAAEALVARFAPLGVRCAL